MKKKYILISIILILLIVVTVGIIRIYRGKRKIERFEYNGYEFEYDKSKWPKYINFIPDKFLSSHALRFYNKNHFIIELGLAYWNGNDEEREIKGTELIKNTKLNIRRVIFGKNVLIVCSGHDCRIYEEVEENKYKHFKAEILGYKDSDILISSPEDLTQNDIDYTILPFLNKIYEARRIGD